MVKKIRENVEISNKVNFRDYSKDFMILRPRVVLLCPLTQHDRITSKREMPRVKIQSFIKEFHVYKAWQLMYFLQAYTIHGPLSFLFVSTSFVTCRLVGGFNTRRGNPFIQRTVEIRSVDIDTFFFFF